MTKLLMRLSVFVSVLALSGPAWPQQSAESDTEFMDQKSADELALDLVRDRKIYQAIVVAVHHGNGIALAVTSKAFNIATDPTLKRDLAILLLQNGTATDEIVEYVSEPVLKVINENIPFPYQVDSQGEILQAEFSDEFLTWCGSRNVEPKQGAQQTMADDQASILILGSARHPSVAPTLLKVLELRNYLSVSNAATALVLINYRGAIPNIIAACERSPASAAATIARSLAMFDDPAAARFIGDAAMLEYLREYGRKLRETKLK